MEIRNSVGEFGPMGTFASTSTQEAGTNCLQEQRWITNTHLRENGVAPNEKAEWMFLQTYLLREGCARCDIATVVDLGRKAVYSQK